MKRLRLFAAVMCFVGAFGCSEDGDGGGSGPGPDESAETITAAEGGEVEVSGGTLTIPAGSLSSDVEIVVAAAEPSADLPDRDSVQGLMYDFGPDGTTFDPPATLELPLEGTPGEGQEAVMSWLDGDHWTDLPTQVSGGAVTAQVAHFTTFVVRFRDVEAGAITCDFAACGGDLVGSWRIDGACADFGTDSDGGSNDPFAACGGTIEIIVDGSGDVEFGADDSFAANINLQPSVSVTMPAACNQMLGIAECAQLSQDLFDGTTCTGDPATACTCEGNQGDPLDRAITGTYTTDGNTFTTSTTEDGGTEVKTNEYCVEGTNMKAKFDDGTILVLSRQ